MRWCSRSVRIWVSLLAGLSGAGCATTGSFAALDSEVSHLRALDVVLDSLWQSEPAALMDADVVVVTYPYSDQIDSHERRDTILGFDAAVEWMKRWRVRNAAGVDVRLLPHNVMRCAGMAIQFGTYEVPRTEPRELEQRAPFQAEWVAGAGGAWRLRGLWLDPDGAAREAWTDAQCRSRRSLEIRSHRTRVGAFAVHRGAPANSTFLSTMREAGYDFRNHRLGDFPRTRAQGTSLGVSAMVRLTPAWGVEASYVGPRSMSVEGQNDLLAPFHTLTLTLKDQLIAALITYDRGIVGVGAGPALAPVKYHWDPGNAAGLEVFDAKETLTGMVAQVSLIAPFSRLVRPVVEIRYTVLATATTPGYSDLAPLAVSLSGPSASVGVAATF